jgi:hypothetical protein
MLMRLLAATTVICAFASSALSYTVHAGSTVTTTSGNVVKAGATDVEVNETPEGDVISGNGAEITLNSAEDSTINGNGNEIEVAGAHETSVNGDENEIDLTGADSEVNVQGDNNVIDHKNETGRSDAWVEGEGKPTPQRG